jgi:hypothetical protein
MDPTGTPLNVRIAPAAEIVGQLYNGTLVSRSETVPDHRGRLWTLVHRFEDGAPVGWVYREFIACF